MRVELQYPVKKNTILGIGEVVVDHITLRRPTVSDMMGLNFEPQFQVASFRVMIHRISGMPYEVLDKIDITDWNNIGEAFSAMTAPKARK